MVIRRHCFYCGKPLSRRRATKDHIIPRSKGGSDSQRNIVDACRKCNTEKGNLLLEEYRQVVAYRLGVDPCEFRFPGEALMFEYKYQRQLERQKKKRAERKASGTCMRCGKLPAQPNRVDCASCRKTANQHRATKRRRGVCSYCSEQNQVIIGTSWCQKCAEKAPRKNKKAYEKRKQLGLCVKCGALPSIEGQVNCETCAAEGRDYHRQNKKTCFDHYGRICTCCERTFDERFLTLDHVNNDGAAHREEIGHSGLYRWAIRNNFPQTLQTHCWSCNQAKEINGGVCPHQEMKSKQWMFD
jgi:hypothetical protein